MAVFPRAVNSLRSPSKAVARRAAKRKSHFFCNIDLTGLLSIELTLLIIFMTLPTPHHNWVLDSPHAVNVTAQPGGYRDDVLRVLVSRDGNTYFRTSKIEVSELHNRLRQFARQQDRSDRDDIARGFESSAPTGRAVGIERFDLVADPDRLAQVVGAPGDANAHLIGLVGVA